MSSLPRIVLASSSPTRKELMQRLGIEFQCHAPDVDETVLANEAPQDLVTRLAQNKAAALRAEYAQHLIIGADVIAWHDNRIIGKPGNHQRAVEQLLSFSMSKVIFYTGMSVLNSQTDHYQTCLETYAVYFRELTPQMVENYLRRDQPYYCAGSIKAEGLASVLFTHLEGDDFTALLGLPLIRLVSMLENEGITLI